MDHVRLPTPTDYKHLKHERVRCDCKLKDFASVWNMRQDKIR